MKKILFVTYGGGHVNMVIPVIKELIKKDLFKVEVLGMTTARSALEKEGLSCFSFSDLPADNGAITYGEALMAGQSSHPLIPWEESVAYMGMSYQCLVAEYGEKKAEERYLKEGRQAFLPVAVMEQLIESGEYDLVVATNSPRAERAAIIAAGNLKVLSLCIVDLFAIQGVKWLGKDGYADKVCVLSNEVKGHLCSAGRKSDDVVVTGNPAFDRLAKPSIEENGHELRLRKGWDNKKVILWCSQPEPVRHPFTGIKGDPKLPFQVEAALKEACDVQDNWHLFVRPHPSENLEMRQYLSGVEYGRDDDLALLLKAVDVVVVTSSTVGLEAALLGVPVIALSMSIFSKDMPFAKMGLGLGVENLGELSSAIEKTISDGGALDVKLPEVGRAAAKITEEICMLLEKGGENNA